MLPEFGTPVRDWLVQSQDFTHLDQDENQLSVYISWWVGLLRDSYDTRKPYRVGIKFLNELTDDYVATVKRYKALAHEFFSSVSQDDFGKYRYKALFRAFAKTPLFRDYMMWRRTKDWRIADWLFTFMLFPSKLPYNDASLATKALSDWFAVEDKLSKLCIKPHILADLRFVVDSFGIVLRPSDFVFRHGPGTVSGLAGKSVDVKFDDFHYTDQIQGFFDYAFGQRRLGPISSPYLGLVLDWYKWDCERDEASARSLVRLKAELIFVRKDISSMRSISREPALFQYSQQAVLEALSKAIDRSSIGKHSGRQLAIVDISSQDGNRDMALDSSVSHRFATSDLSKASDSVSWQLVEGIFSGKLLEALSLTRTQLVLVDEGKKTPRTVKVNKFAPMGSACCFPVQCIVFTSIISLVTTLHAEGISVFEYLSSDQQFFNTDAMRRKGVADLDEGTRVYGDDLVIREHQVSDVHLLLTALGFEVNEAKSFSGDSCARESCGVFAMDGHDLAPIRPKIEQGGVHDTTYKVKAARIALANELYRRGWIHCRDSVLRTVPYAFWYYCGDENRYGQDFAVLGFEENTHRRFRYNPQLQRLEISIKRHYLEGDSHESLTTLPVTEVRASDSPHERPVDGYGSGFTADPRSEMERNYRYSLWSARPFLSEGKRSIPPGEEESQDKVKDRWTPFAN